MVLQNSAKAHPDLPNVPLAINFAKTDLGRKLIQVALHDISTITYLYTLPPKTPKDRVQILRRAFQETMHDPEFLAEAKKGNLELEPVAGDELEKVVNSLFKVDRSTVNKLREILK